RAKDAKAGYAPDFVSAILKPNLAEIARRGVKVISNAGGVNVAACADAVAALVKAQGLNLKVAAIYGDDLLDRRADFAAHREMYSKEAFPPQDAVMSVNAYLGAFPIAKALEAGADIVITGRCVDSAVTLGACIHAFGWGRDEFDKLAAGSLAGHIIECGAQATGGNYTDWESVADTIDAIGYPIAEVSADGSFVCCKPPGTGGAVTVGTVAEQMLYEIGDPQAYMLPDVVCDFSGVTIEGLGDDRVRVRNARGAPAPDSYKVSVTFSEGYRGGRYATFYGIAADRKAQAYADAVLRRTRTALRARNLADFTETSVEVLGAESQYGQSRSIADAREVVVKMAVRHPEAAGVDLFLREGTGLGLAAPPSLSGFAGGRPASSPVVRLFSFALAKEAVRIDVQVGGETIAYEGERGEAFDPTKISRPAIDDGPASTPADMVRVPLIELAYGRSGDKGDKANIGVIARDPAYLPWIRRALTPGTVAARFAHFLKGKVERYELPGSHALNFLLHDALGGGGVASLRNDAQGKGYASLLLDHPIPVPRQLARKHKLREQAA
ncbi:MAG: acyclic terpene utilization AtuA family protein, partial [Hyphomonadaceae bacterium]